MGGWLGSLQPPQWYPTTDLRMHHVNWWLAKIVAKSRLLKGFRPILSAFQRVGGSRGWCMAKRSCTAWGFSHAPTSFPSPSPQR